MTQTNKKEVNNEEIKNSYNGDSIQILEELDKPRFNPGMYIGSTGPKGLHHLVYEIVDNSVDECMEKHCNLINVIINEDGSITVADNGRGIPVEVNSKTGKSAARLVFEQLHAGGKFSGNNYKVSGGLHGVGASVVNAFSEWLTVNIYKNGKEYRLRYIERKIQGDIEEIGTTRKRGTTVTFMPDATILETIKFSYNTLKNRLRELAFLNKGLKITIEDKRSGKYEEFMYLGGIEEYIKDLTNSKNLIHKSPITINSEKSVRKRVLITETTTMTVDSDVDENKVPIIIKNEKTDKKEITVKAGTWIETDRDVEVEISFQYTEDFTSSIYSFVNNISTPDGGTHVTGFNAALTSVMNDFGKREGLLKEKDEAYTVGDVSEGLVALVSAKLSYRPEFEGQTKNKLGNTEVRSVVNAIVTDKLEQFFAINKEETRRILEKVDKASKIRQASKKSKDLLRKASKPINMFGKLTDCSTKNRAEAECYMVEGDSAGGSAKQGRYDRTKQAVLPLKGKILNIESNSIDKIVKNDEITLLDNASGVGSLTECDVTKSRYGKYIIMTDADIDGAHIKNLLLTYFFRYKRPIIEHGMLYIAVPPLYKIETTCKKEYYVQNDEELEIKKKELAKAKQTIKHLQRYKGLGEMNPDQIRTTCMNPKTRVIKQVTIDDAILADKLISTFMGKKTQPRLEYMQEHIEPQSDDLFF